MLTREVRIRRKSAVPAVRQFFGSWVKRRLSADVVVRLGRSR